MHIPCILSLITQFGHLGKTKIDRIKHVTYTTCVFSRILIWCFVLKEFRSLLKDQYLNTIKKHGIDQSASFQFQDV